MESMENFGQRKSGGEAEPYPSAEGLEVSDVEVEDVTLESGDSEDKGEGDESRE